MTERNLPGVGFNSCARFTVANEHESALFEFFENFFRPLNDRLRNSGELRDLDSVASVRSAAHYTAQEGYIIAALFDGYIVILDAVYLPFELGQLVIMSGKKSLCADALFVCGLFEHGSRDAHAVESGSASSYLIKDYKASRSCVIEYRCNLAHLDHKRRLSG